VSLGTADVEEGLVGGGDSGGCMGLVGEGMRVGTGISVKLDGEFS
jgi:hypothetical protein